MRGQVVRALGFGLMGLTAAAATACSSKNGPTSPSAQSLYTKYGGAPTIQKVVDDAVTGVLADPVEAPFFAVIGQPGHDSGSRLKSCLRLQFTAVFGGPAKYPGTNDQGDKCEDMVEAHADLAITGPVFDRFITDLTGVLAADGVSQGDIATVAPTLLGLKSQIVTR